MKKILFSYDSGKIVSARNGTQIEETKSKFNYVQPCFETFL